MDQANSRKSNDSFREKTRRDRTKVRKRMKELRKELEELELAQQEGKDNKADIEACKGKMQVLKKEVKSINEGGHTTFVAAKKMLEPKKGVGAKNRNIKFRRVQLNRKIAKLEGCLTESELSPEDRQEILTKLAKLKEDRTALTQEKKALTEYNHTRFMEFAKEKVDADKQERELAEINNKITAAEDVFAKATESDDSIQIEEAKENLHLLLMEKESIENFAHDLFLKNIEQLKAKRRSELA